MATGEESSVGPLLEVKMVLIAGIRKAFLKERLIPTPLNGNAKKKSRERGSQGKTGRKSDLFAAR
jgi:hypothetical protein